MCEGRYEEQNGCNLRETGFKEREGRLKWKLYRQ